MIDVQDMQGLVTVARDLRKRAHLSQEKLAELSGLSRTAIQNFEAGKETCQIDTVFKVLKVLNARLHLSHPLIGEGVKYGR